MLRNPGYGPPFRRRRRSVLTHGVLTMPVPGSPSAPRAKAPRAKAPRAKITAKAVSTSTTYTATVVGYDKTGDIALTQLRNASGLTATQLGNSINTALPVARQIAAGHVSSAITIGYPPFAGIFTGGPPQ